MPIYFKYCNSFYNPEISLNFTYGVSIEITFEAWQAKEKNFLGKSNSESFSDLSISKSAVKSSAPNAAAINLPWPAFKIYLILKRPEVDSIWGITFKLFSGMLNLISYECKNLQMSIAISAVSTFVTQNPSIDLTVS